MKKYTVFLADGTTTEIEATKIRTYDGVINFIVEGSDYDEETIASFYEDKIAGWIKERKTNDTRTVN